MTGLPIGAPEECGFDAGRLQRACDLLDGWARSGEVPAAALCVGGRGRTVAPHLTGRQRPGADAPLRDDALFLVASITKPVTVTAVMRLVERGAVALEDPVAAYVPRFAARGKGDVQLRHLMTHTSGLPDMLPDNDRLRAAHEPLSVFIDHVCALPLQFPQGTRVQYQSMGTAMLA